MPKTLVIHQPNLLPRLKVMQKISRSDAWVVLDDVQYVIREWQNRARLRYVREPDREFWLTLPARRPNRRSTLISQVEVVDPARNLQRLHRSITHAYRSSPYWADVAAVADQIPATADLTALAVASTQAMLSAAGFSPRTVMSSGLATAGRRVGKLIAICKALDATCYVTGSGGASYTDPSAFARAGISIRYQDWRPPATEPPLHWRNISALDFLARFGATALRKHLCDWAEVDGDVGGLKKLVTT